MSLPQSDRLPVSRLAGAFFNTSATYKFYWLLAIIEQVEQGRTTISKKDLFARMIANAWYTVNYFKISFGRQDLIQQAVQSILQDEGLTIDIKKSELLHRLENSQKKTTEQNLWHFNKNVPHWFLSPWFVKTAGESDSNFKNRICRSSGHFENDCLYALHEDHIAINPNWMGYLKDNAKILKDFIYWNLTLFLQARNPNVPDIANKLLRPPFRGSLANQRKNYWDIVFRELGTLECIFTNAALEVEHYALDHFVPHAFVSHDLLWNLLPIDKSFNSKKSDNLPSLELHYDSFFNLQRSAYEIVSHHNPKNALLQDYLTVFPDLFISKNFDYHKLKENIQPLIAIAHNNGFLYLY